MEETTKNAMMVPFIHALGYDIFNPAEVVLEFTADIGIEKGEKVDDAILKDGRPIIMFETRWSGADLNQVHAVVQVFFGRARSSLWRRHQTSSLLAARRLATVVQLARIQAEKAAVSGYNGNKGEQP